MASQFPGLSTVRVIEPDNVPEFFVTTLAGFAIHAGLIRLAFSVERSLLTGVPDLPLTRIETIVRCRLVMPLDREREMNRDITNRIVQYQSGRPVN